MEFSINIGCNVSEEWTASQEITLCVSILVDNLINFGIFIHFKLFVILKDSYQMMV